MQQSNSKMNRGAWSALNILFDLRPNLGDETAYWS